MSDNCHVCGFLKVEYYGCTCSSTVKKLQQENATLKTQLEKARRALFWIMQDEFITNESVLLAKAVLSTEPKENV